MRILLAAIIALGFGAPAMASELDRQVADARGLSLAAKDGCSIEIDTEAWIANLPRATKRSLHSACRQVVDYMRPRLGNNVSANAAGEAARAAYAQRREELLTPSQMLRIASIVEDGLGLLCR
ncbi:hypothetical protein MWU52_14980 [Jannaschia sp. S6380]|uniref:hypothetical protein n=1 Tax=Jannaschia sp. S6380 TaxID=2926408 RepID=UPI001FF5CBAA|nr:hypothetical protein [Jannaschia sp. S6380]MCK0168856.1 hypothetical protein [Jannaschia sp. S6380]